MKIRRRAPTPTSTRFDAGKVKTILVRESVRLVTLDDPASSPETASGAFARLQPPEGLSPVEVDSWRERVAAVARAVKVLPAPRSADVPTASQRVDEDEVVGTIRDEAMALAEETKNPAVIELVTKTLDEVGA